MAKTEKNIYLFLLHLSIPRNIFLGYHFFLSFLCIHSTFSTNLQCYSINAKCQVNIRRISITKILNTVLYMVYGINLLLLILLFLLFILLLFMSFLKQDFIEHAIQSILVVSSCKFKYLERKKLKKKTLCTLILVS